jgi:nitroreductase
VSAPQPVLDVMRRRFSCRTYSGEPLAEADLRRLGEAADAMRTGPFGSRLRFHLAAAAPGDEAALRRLGTYGMIRGMAGFLVGAAERGPMYLEDYGWAMERLILEATRLGLGTCWVGGLFTRGAFARRIRVSRRERIPAVAAVGLISDPDKARDGLARRATGGTRRKPWTALFHDGEFGRPLAPGEAGRWAEALEMVRLAPSASNQQPWRVVRSGSSWHFFIRRTPRYPPRIGRWLIGIEDLQRVDSGIAMCHFELAAREAGLGGRWVVKQPPLPLPDELTEYSATWEG